MKIDLAQFRQLYLQESAEHVLAMEEGLFALRSAPGDPDVLNAIFRAAHSIKGGAGSFGMDVLVAFTHVLESLLDQLRSGLIAATSHVHDTLLQSIDVLRGLLTADAATPMSTTAQQVMASLQALMQQGAETASSVEAEPAQHTPHTPAEHLYRIHLVPDPTIFENGCSPLLLLRSLASLGRVVHCQLHSDRLPDLEVMDPDLCYLVWTLELQTAASEADLREVFEFVDHLVNVQIEQLPATATTAAAHQAAAEAPHAQPAPIPTQPATPTPSSPQAPPAPPAQSTANPSCPLPGVAALGAAPQGGGCATASRITQSSIRVSIDKVDRLVDLVGEIVIAQSMAAQSIENLTPAMLPRMRETAAALERSVRELHESIMSIRMLPLGTLFQRYTRTVYDIARSTGKQVRLVLLGTETEIDKGMLELLADPMLHLLRNAVDHGIESPAERQAAGKPDEGTITLRASHRGGKIVLHIQDDGAGIDPERVRHKAIERGLIAEHAELTPPQLRMLIFEPGFSTRDAVSELSGRGVGMDVVRRNIQGMNGSVTLDSTVGQGSCITVELPLTLAILDGLVVRVEDRRMVVPLLNVLETVPCTEDDLMGIVGLGEVLILRGEPVPVLRLHHHFDIPRTGTPAERALVVVVEADDRKVGLFLDEVLGQQQVVLKSLEAHLYRVPGLMGATILGDGSVAPILDVVAVVEREPAPLPRHALVPHTQAATLC